MGKKHRLLVSLIRLNQKFSNMSEVIIFKFIDTYQNESASNYKILRCEDGRSFRIHANEINYLKNNLKTGQFISCVIEGNEAKKLRLLREVGVINSYNTEKGFGSAKLLINDSDLLKKFERCENGTAEVFVHINEVNSASKDIKRGDIVVFDIRKIYQRDKNKYRDDALNLKLLNTEIDGEIIDNCVNSDNIDVLLAVFSCSLNDYQYDRAVN